MQITSKVWKSFLGPGGDGTVNVTPEDADDIWALYNIISTGDEVECVTMRKVLQESNSGEVVDSQKIKMVLSVVVEKVEVDLQNGCIRVNGRNTKENKHVKLGSYHTLDVETDRWVKISKKEWDALDIEVLEQALKSVGKTEVGAIVMQEGLAHICSVSPFGTKVLQKVEVSMPKKKLGPTSQSEKAFDKFFAQCLEAFIQHIKFEQLKAIVIAGTEDLKDKFYQKLLDFAQNNDDKTILSNKNKCIRLTVSSGQLASLTELLKEPRVASILADTKASNESRVMDSYYKMYNNDPDRTTFGPEHVQRATEDCAVKHLLISDSLFRSHDVRTRRIYSGIVSTVKENGGEVTIFSTGSQPDAELIKLTGIAAILNFPIE